MQTYHIEFYTILLIERIKMIFTPKMTHGPFFHGVVKPHKRFLAQKSIPVKMIWHERNQVTSKWYAADDLRF